ncbi:ATP-binding protein [Hymenobacter cellulosilyticus]|uniref:ATP-binding protein n=1 Tax=Hymenobacter cellulosilyticus TaxID=2932248 RepID=A0A8T9Q7H4_9BACT|nr:ATP-binding protein [Hymenobacter cellulosilyticus]UOQ71459.1 ATP-binding protein [Hymenobacter cellulosilyticus]
MINIYDADWLADFFHLNQQGRLIRRESVTTEFKREFDWASKESRSKYAKSMAAFANNRGGCLVFGIKNAPHEVVGISNFMAIDDAVITTFLNELFTPYIEFERTEHEVDGKTIGIIWVKENQTKPVVCIKDSAVTFGSDIYFRYGAKSEKIKAGDLVNIINQVREDETRKWRNIFEKCATIGVDNIGFLNKKTGEIKSNANTFILDEALLNQIQIVDKYSEKTEGSPALRIIGEIPEVARVITRAKPLYEEDLIKAFSTGHLEATPQDYIRAIVHGNTVNVPVYFLFHAMQLNIHQSIDFVSNLATTHRQKDNLLKRLRDILDMNKKHAIHTLGGTPHAEKRKEYFELIVSSQSVEITNVEEAARVSESLYSLRGDIYSHAHCLPILDKLRSYSSEMKQGQRYTFRGH